MMKLGADYNYTEYTNIDLLFINKVIMDKIYLGIKQERLREEYSRNTNQSVEIGKKRSSFGEINYNVIFSSILKNNEISNDLGDLREYHSKIVYVHDNICEKIRTDHTIRPLRIFWIKADYFLLTKILTVMSGGAFMLLSFSLSHLLKGITV